MTNKRLSNCVFFEGILLFTLVIVGMVGCGISKRVTRVGDMPTLSKGDFLRLYDGLKESDVVDAKGYLSANFDGQEFEVGTRWSLRVDQEFVLSLRFLGLMEAGRLTVTHDKLALVDRVGKRGILLENLSTTLSDELNFYNVDPKILAALVHHRPFSNKNIRGEALRGMTFSTDPDKRLYIFKDHRHGIQHEFDASLNLVRSTVKLFSGEFIQIEYADFVTIQEQRKPYPKSIVLTITARDTRRHVILAFDLDGFSTRFSQKVDIGIPSNYKLVSLSQLKDLISDLSK
ncbi:DUF4292 domain-containing protein [Porphyromonas sp.]|uniref:DUF4292 domain-containing protein n=1 Tax=Porphyromonas sp. TaxID=1924944 RepID=UPI0026DCD236|nr:DUF4292 domain-containing protein [Porphyromonas sp.]MDO4695691.1 DUF4292 domain-containing protein [Porphyromonas sp.]MDO4771712.1 DUF4292 domain-containing protein [Porphyromonas sp.]